MVIPLDWPCRTRIVAVFYARQTNPMQRIDVAFSDNFDLDAAWWTHCKTRHQPDYDGIPGASSAAESYVEFSR